MKSVFQLVALAAAYLVFGSTTSNALPQIEFSHNVFHMRVCVGPDVAGAARCHAHVLTDRAGNIFTREVARNVTPSGYGPSDLRSAYAVSGSGSSSVTLAIVDAYGYSNAEKDLGVYRSQFGLPACTTANSCFTKYNQRGQKSNYPSNNTGWSQETALDLDMASAICPACKIILVEATSATYANLAAAENTAAALGAHVISNSYGGSESGSQSYEAAYNHPGVAITVSSGDSGYGVQFPASSPHVTATGGTSLARVSGGRGWTEAAWPEGGSGCSSIYAKPSWQTDPLCTKRMEADVSAVSDPATGVAVYGPLNALRSGWEVFGGTSVAAPLIAGIYAVNGGAVNAGSNPYAAGASLFDVTTGSNGSCGGTYFCTSGPGYDGPTGLGTPNGVSAY